MTGVYVGVPTLTGMLPAELVYGLLEGWSSGLVRQWCERRGSFLPRNRDLICADFLGSDCTHLLCLDADIVWRASDLAALLALATDFSFGYYQVKRAGGPLTCDEPIGSHTIGGVEVNEHAGCGAGFVLLSRSCVERMTAAYADERYEYQGRLLTGLWQTSGRVTRSDGRVVAEGEDYAFCRRWRALGGRIYGHPGVVLGHLGSRVWRPEA
jgi:hypothetical protein